MKKTTKEAFADLANRYMRMSDEEKVKVRDALTAFTGVRREAVREWFANRHFPVGVPFIKLRHALIGLGYRIQTYEEMPEALKYMSTLVAHDVVKVKDAYSQIGYPTTDAFIRPLTEGVKAPVPLPERMRRIEALCGGYRKELEAAWSLEAEHWKLNGETRYSKPAVSHASATGEETVGLLEVLSGAHALATVGIPLLEKLLSEETGVEGRREFRDAFGVEKLFRFSNLQYRFAKLVNAIRSEKAKELFEQEFSSTT